MFSWNGDPFFIFPLSKLWKESNFPSLAFMKVSCLELHDFTPFKPKNLWGRSSNPPPPLPRHIYNTKTTMSSVCLCREGLVIPLHGLTQINNGLERRFYFCRGGRTATTLRFLSFFFAWQNFRKVGPPENSWIRACSMCSPRRSSVC